MTSHEHKTTIAPVPLVTGILLWAAATALMLEDCYRAGTWDAQHLAVPILTASTCVAGALAHLRLARFRFLSGLGLAALALLGSTLCVLNTLGRTATDRDHRIAVAMAQNRVLHDRQGELDRARLEMTRECKARGPRCREWESRVDQLQRETAPMLAVAVDPRADAIGRLASLVGFEADKAKAIVRAVEPAALPIFLEVGAIILLGVSFGSREVATVTVSSTELTVAEERMAKVFTKADALADLQTLKASGSQQFLAHRWGVSEPTVSKWMSTWQATGTIDRNRQGKTVQVLAIAPPQRKRLGKVA
jgi:hypothetical protein